MPRQPVSGVPTGEAAGRGPEARLGGTAAVALADCALQTRRGSPGAVEGGGASVAAGSARCGTGAGQAHVLVQLRDPGAAAADDLVLRGVHSSRPGRLALRPCGGATGGAP